MSEPGVREIIKQLKQKEIQVFDVPEELKNHRDIVKYERESGLRVVEKRGYDVISDSFFVEEAFYPLENATESKEQKTTTFDDFDDYYDFLSGEIYDNACYAFWNIPKEIKESGRVDVQKLFARTSFVEKTIDDYSLVVSDQEKAEYKAAERIYKSCEKWDEKFAVCKSCDDLIKVVEKYRKSKLCPEVSVSFFLYNYVFRDITDEKRFTVIMDYLSKGGAVTWDFVYALCLIYEPAKVLQAFQYSSGTKSTRNRHNREVKRFVERLQSGKIELFTIAYFDKKTHFYCEETRGYKKGSYFPTCRFYRNFSSFDSFIEYRKGDLSGCDLSGAIELKLDITQYVTDKKTKLPASFYHNVSYSVKKYYKKGEFVVLQRWSDENGAKIKDYRHKFQYFFDWVDFLKGDLSDSVLISCDGLKYLQHWETVNFSGAQMTSELSQKFGISSHPYSVQGSLVESFSDSEQNESETLDALEAIRDLETEAKERHLSVGDLVFEYRCKMISYVSDIHLLHRIQNANCRSQEDVIYTVQRIVDNLAKDTRHVLLIDGDVCSDFSLFRLFVSLLSDSLINTVVIFTLGNHELWSFPGLSIDKITEKYRNYLKKYGMYLLQNDLLYKEDIEFYPNEKGRISVIGYEELCAVKQAELLDKLRKARYVIFGGSGFSGYNKDFNADNGIYRKVLGRKEELQETEKFEQLYQKLLPVLSRKNTVVMTHTPKKDWCADPMPDKNIVYLSGHTHRNYFYDDGEYRIYSDNQVGYHHENVHVKTLLLDSEYDVFDDYEDGIYEITKQQYKDFYRGKNLYMTFDREVNVIYLLKKNKHYCFIHKAQNGNLTMLNGGAKKSLGVKDVQYYFNNMDVMVSKIKQPLDGYTAYQNQISKFVKEIGGAGSIHGCIIDIDFYNHIYVNPVNTTITVYWAADIINKVVYSDIATLLQENCPQIYCQYMKLLEENDGNTFLPSVGGSHSFPKQVYLETDIYKASREIKKMQKLYSNIRSTWPEKLEQGRLMEK